MKSGLVKLAFIITVAIIMLPQVSFARASYWTGFRNHYPNSPASNCFQCILCHTNGSNPSKQDLNPYAISFKNKWSQLQGGGNPPSNWNTTGDQALSQIQPDDSDGDTVLNIDEINVGSNPGDSAVIVIPTACQQGGTVGGGGAGGNTTFSSMGGNQSLANPNALNGSCSVAMVKSESASEDISNILLKLLMYGMPLFAMGYLKSVRKYSVTA